MLRFLLLTLAALLAGPAAATEPSGIATVEVQGSAFVVTTADGRVLEQHELVGAVLDAVDEADAGLTLRIEGIERDTLDASGETVLYRLARRDPSTGSWGEACEPDPEGRRLGFPLAGRWTEDGRHADEPGRFIVTCTAGAIGKCVRFGYRPWATGPDGRSLRGLHQACVRLLRADYCGDGSGHTRDGTSILLFDDLAIQRDEPASGMTFEAGFDENGAVCVARPRIPALLPADALPALCPGRLPPERVGEACTEARAREAWGAVLFVRS